MTGPGVMVDNKHEHRVSFDCTQMAAGKKVTKQLYKKEICQSLHEARRWVKKTIYCVTLTESQSAFRPDHSHQHR